MGGHLWRRSATDSIDDERGNTGTGKAIAGGDEEEDGGSPTCDSDQRPLHERSQLERESYWLRLWAFCTSRDGLGLSEKKFRWLTVRKYNALFRVWADARYWEDLRAARLQLDFRNAWFVSKEHHPNGWTLDEILAPRGGKKEEANQGNSPEAWAWYQAVKMKFNMAIATGGKTWNEPDYFPLPS